MAKIWLRIWLKVKENGTKKIKLAKMVVKEKEILVRTLVRGFLQVPTRCFCGVNKKYQHFLVKKSALSRAYAF